MYAQMCNISNTAYTVYTCVSALGPGALPSDPAGSATWPGVEVKWPLFGPVSHGSNQEILENRGMDQNLLYHFH